MAGPPATSRQVKALAQAHVEQLEAKLNVLEAMKATLPASALQRSGLSGRHPAPVNDRRVQNASGADRLAVGAANDDGRLSAAAGCCPARSTARYPVGCWMLMKKVRRSGV